MAACSKCGKKAGLFDNFTPRGEDLLCPACLAQSNVEHGVTVVDDVVREGQPTLIAKGVNGQVEVHPNKVVIKRKGVLSLMTQGLKADKAILISSITSIQFKKCGLATNGYIQLAFQGGHEAKGGIFQATQDENTVMFNSFQQAQFVRVKDAIEEALMAFSNRMAAPAAPQPMSVADEIEKLAGLREKGFLTDQEFQSKKRQLLGL